MHQDFIKQKPFININIFTKGVYMSQIEQEIKHNIEKGRDYADWVKRGAEVGLKSVGRLTSGFIPAVSYYRDTGGRLYRVTTPGPLSVMLFKRVPRYEVIRERSV